MPGSPTGRRSAARSCCCRARRIRSRGSTCCARSSRCCATRSWSRTRASATRSSRSSTTPWTGSAAFLAELPDRRLMASPGRTCRDAASARILTAPRRRCGSAARARPVPVAAGVPRPRPSKSPCAPLRPDSRRSARSPRRPGRKELALRVRVRPPSGGRRRHPRDGHPARRRRPRSRPSRKDPPGSRQVHERDRQGRIRRAATPPATRPRAPTASTRSCRRTGRPGRGSTSATPTRKQTRPTRSGSPRGEVPRLYNWLGTWRRVAYWWLTGSSRTSGWSSCATVRRQGHDATTRGSPMPTAPDPVVGKPKPEPTVTGYSERSGHDRLRGDLEVRRGTAATRATASGTRPEAGATATLTFTGQAVAWYGPVGPTRGKARVLDRRRGGQDRRPPAARASRPTRRSSATSWKTRHATPSRSRSLGTAGHPMVAHRRVRRPLTDTAERAPCRGGARSAGGDHLDLDAEVRGQGRDADRRPRRRLGREVLAVDRVHRRELAEVAQVDGALTTSA